MAENLNPSHRPTYLPRNWRLLTVVGTTTVGLACGMIQIAGAELPTVRKTAKPAVRVPSVRAKTAAPENGFVATIRRLMADSKLAADKGDYAKAVQLAERAAKISEASAQLLGPPSECSPEETAKFAAEMRARNEAYARGREQAVPGSQLTQAASTSSMGQDKHQHQPLAAASASKQAGMMRAGDSRPAGTGQISSPKGPQVASGRPVQAGVLSPSRTAAVPALVGSPQNTGDVGGSKFVASDVPPAPRLDDRPDSRTGAAAELLLDQARKSAQHGDIEDAIRLAEQSLALSAPSIAVFGRPRRSKTAEEAMKLLAELDQRQEIEKPQQSVATQVPPPAAPPVVMDEPIALEEPTRFEAPLQAAANQRKAKIIRSSESFVQETVADDVPPEPVDSEVTDDPFEADRATALRDLAESPPATEAGSVRETVPSAHVWRPTATAETSSASDSDALPPAPQIEAARGPLRFARTVPDRSAPWDESDPVETPVPDPEPRRASTEDRGTVDVMQKSASADSIPEFPIAVHLEPNRAIAKSPARGSEIPDDTGFEPIEVITSKSDQKTQTANPAAASSDLKPGAIPLRRDRIAKVAATTPLSSDVIPAADVAVARREDSPKQETPFTLQNESQTPAVRTTGSSNVIPASEPMPTNAIVAGSAEQTESVVDKSDKRGEESIHSGQSASGTSLMGANEVPKPPIRLRRNQVVQAQTDVPSGTKNELKKEEQSSVVAETSPGRTTPKRSSIRLRGSDIISAAAQASTDESSQIQPAGDWVIVPAESKPAQTPPPVQSTPSVRPFAIKTPKQSSDSVTDAALKRSSEVDGPVQRFPVQRVIQLQKRLESAASLNPGGVSEDTTLPDFEAAEFESNNGAISSKPDSNQTSMTIKAQPASATAETRIIGAQVDFSEDRIKRRDTNTPEEERGWRSETNNANSKTSGVASPRPAVVKLRQRPGTPVVDHAALMNGTATQVPKTPSSQARKPAVGRSEFVGWKTFESDTEPTKGANSTESPMADSSIEANRGGNNRVRNRDAKRESFLPPSVSQARFETSTEVASNQFNAVDGSERKSGDWTQSSDSSHSQETGSKRNLAPPPPPEVETPSLSLGSDESNTEEGSKFVTNVVHKSSFTLIDQVAAFFKLPIPTTVSLIGCVAAALLGFGLMTLRLAIRSKHTS